MSGQDERSITTWFQSVSLPEVWATSEYQERKAVKAKLEGVLAHLSVSQIEELVETAKVLADNKENDA